MSDEHAPLWRGLLHGWIAIAGRFGFVQTLVLLAFLYVFLVGPVALVQSLGRADQLDKRGLWKGGRSSSAWRESESGGADLDRAKLQS